MRNSCRLYLGLAILLVFSAEAADSLNVSASPNSPIQKGEVVTITATDSESSSTTITLTVTGATPIAPDTQTKTGNGSVSINVLAEIDGKEQIKVVASTSSSTKIMSLDVIEVLLDGTNPVNLHARMGSEGYTYFIIHPAELANKVIFTCDSTIKVDPTIAAGNPQRVAIETLVASPGTAVVNAQLQGRSITCATANVNIIKVEFSSTSLSIPFGKTGTVNATVTPTSAESYIVYSVNNGKAGVDGASSSPVVVTVTSGGSTTETELEATFLGSSSDQSTAASIPLYVVGVSSVSATPPTINGGDTTTFRAYPDPYGAPWPTGYPTWEIVTANASQSTTPAGDRYTVVANTTFSGSLTAKASCGDASAQGSASVNGNLSISASTEFLDFGEVELANISSIDKWIAINEQGSGEVWPSPRTVDDPQRVFQFKAASNISGLT